ncbi:hypothetical protein RRG08_005229 [Elysia crispata]|uniref:Uncharacterized protein n=1 Tax=Elysia crispata TaxID=231223 RepID=A0AAE1ALQ6_9GAST|nr:hypothetical protein RRG08_005229 [Elysia crispata]
MFNLISTAIFFKLSSYLTFPLNSSTEPKSKLHDPPKNTPVALNTKHPRKRMSGRPADGKDLTEDPSVKRAPLALDLEVGFGRGRPCQGSLPTSRLRLSASSANPFCSGLYIHTDGGALSASCRAQDI